MTTEPIEYTPAEPFTCYEDGVAVPRIFGSPARYVQGAGVIRHAGQYLRRLGFTDPRMAGRNSQSGAWASHRGI